MFRNQKYYLGGSKSPVTCCFFCVKANTIIQCIIFIKYYIQNAKITAIALFVIMRNRVIILEQRKALQKINEMNSIFHIIRLTSLSVIIGYSIILNNVTGWKIH
jgi:hypothetical protein